MTEEEIWRRYGHQLVIPIPHSLEWVIRYMTEASPLELALLNKRVREISSYCPPEPQWPKISPEELERIVKTAWVPIELVGLVSFHPSGYIRELAVRRLTRMTGGQELPFLLLRPNDWVVPVSQTALMAVQERITPQYADALVRSILLVFNLAGQKRRKHMPMLSAVTDLLKRPECDAALQWGMAAPEKQARRLCFRILWEAADARLPEAVSQMLADLDPVIRQAASHCARVTLPDDALRALLPLMKRDSSLPVRREALYTCLERLPELAPSELRTALLDPNAAMREIARYHLRQSGDFDVQGFYRQALAASAVPSELGAAISGLGETGTALDVGLILPSLSHPLAKVRRTAVKAVSRLDGDNYIDAFLAALTDERPSVSHEAREALRTRLGLLDEGALWRLFKTASLPHIRRDVLLLLASLPKWESVPFLVEAAVDKDPLIQEQAAKQLRGWFSGYNRNFVRPAPIQLARLKEALRKNPDAYLEAIISEWKAKGTA